MTHYIKYGNDSYSGRSLNHGLVKNISSHGGFKIVFLPRYKGNSGMCKEYTDKILKDVEGVFKSYGYRFKRSGNTKK